MAARMVVAFVASAIALAAHAQYSGQQQTIRQQQQINQQDQLRQRQNQLDYDANRARIQQDRSSSGSYNYGTPSTPSATPSSNSGSRSSSPSSSSTTARPQQSYEQYMREREARLQEQARYEAYWQAQDDYQWRCMKEGRLEQPECQHVKEQIAYETQFHNVRSRMSQRAWSDYRTMQKAPPGMEQELRRLEEQGNKWAAARDAWNKLSKQEQDAKEAQGRLAAQNAGIRGNPAAKPPIETTYFMRLEPARSGAAGFYDCVYTRVNGQEVRGTPSGGSSPRCSDTSFYMMNPRPI